VDVNYSIEIFLLIMKQEIRPRARGTEAHFPAKQTNPQRKISMA